MSIPAFTISGLLPEGVHDCTLEELRDRFGQFQESDARCRIFEKLTVFLRHAAAARLVAAVIVNGSFVTSKASPCDVDVIVVVRAEHNFAVDLRPFEYNVVSKKQIRRMFQIDALVGIEGGNDLDRHVQLFSRVREDPTARKGMARITL